MKNQWTKVLQAWTKTNNNNNNTNTKVLSVWEPLVTRVTAWSQVLVLTRALTKSQLEEAVTPHTKDKVKDKSRIQTITKVLWAWVLFPTKGMEWSRVQIQSSAKVVLTREALTKTRGSMSLSRTSNQVIDKRAISKIRTWNKTKIKVSLKRSVRSFRTWSIK